MKGWWSISFGALLSIVTLAGTATEVKTKLSCVLSVVSTGLTEDDKRFSDELVVEVTDSKPLWINGIGTHLDFWFFDLGVNADSSNFYKSYSTKDVWSVDTRTRDMTRYADNVIIFEKININRFTGTLTYSLDEDQSGISLKKISATGKCEKMEGTPPKF